MNSSVPSLSRSSATSVPSVAKIELSPLVYALALSLRVRRAFGECLESVTRIIAHLRAEITHRAKLSADIAAIDDDLEREFPLFVELLANDPPPKRRRALAILRGISVRTQHRAQEADPKCPKHLLAD